MACQVELGNLSLPRYLPFVIVGMICCGPNSLKDFSTDYLIVSVCAILTVLGSLGFIVWNELYEKLKIQRKNKLSFRKTWLTLTTHSKLVLSMLVILIIFGSAIFLLIEYNNPATLGKYSFGDKMFISIFHGISARTTGMAVVDLMEMTNSGKFFTMILMLIGGAPRKYSGWY